MTLQQTTVRRAAKDRPCGSYPCRRTIRRGELYNEHVIAPGSDAGNERWWRSTECGDCATQAGRPPVKPGGALTLEQMVRAFHHAAGLSLPDDPTLDIGAEFVSDEVRQKILDEEVQELRDAVAARDLTGIADALADIAYVVAGTAVTYGIPFDVVLAEVHKSNMTKFTGWGPRLREDGKILKGPGYEPPRIAEILAASPEGSQS